MGKKVLGIVLLLGAAGAGIWHFAAERFDEQAQHMVSQLNSLKPYLTYSDVKIDKYRFQIHLTDVSIGTAAQDASQMKPFRVDFKAQNSFFYNPFTKTLSIYGKETNNTSNEYIIHHGDKKTSIRPVVEGKTPIINLSFHDHPNLKDSQWLAIVSLIKRWEASYAKLKYINTSNNKEILSLDSLEHKADVNVMTEDHAQDYLLHIQDQYKNYVIHDEFIAILKEIISSYTNDAKVLAQLDGYFGLSINQPMNTKTHLKFTAPKGEMAPFIDLIKGGSLPSADQVIPVIPSMKIDIDSESDSFMGKATTGYYLDYKKSEASGKVSLTSDMSATDALRTFIAQMIIQSLKETQPSITISEQDMIEMVPDVATLSPIKINFLIDMSLKNGPELKDLKLLVANKNSHIDLSAQSTLPEINGSLELKNYKGIRDDISAYLDRLIQKGQTIEGLMAVVASMKVMIMTIDHFVSQLASAAPDQSIISFKGNYNMATGQGSINGKSLAEIMSLIPPTQPSNNGQSTPSTQPNPTLPMMPGVPAQPTTPESMIPGMPAQPTTPESMIPGMPAQPDAFNQNEQTTHSSQPSQTQPMESIQPLQPPLPEKTPMIESQPLLGNQNTQTAPSDQSQSEAAPPK